MKYCSFHAWKAPLILILLVLFGCSGLNITKRQYNPGWHVSTHGKSNQASIKPKRQHPEHQLTTEESISIESTQVAEEPQAEFETSQATSAQVIIQKPKIHSVQTAPQRASEITSTPRFHEVASVDSHSPSNLLWLALLPLLGVVAFPFRKASSWASKHKKTAQVAFGISSVLLAAFSFLLGGLAGKHGLQSPSNAVLFTSMASVLGMLIYPSTKANASNYVSRKVSDTFLLTSGLATSALLGNQIAIGNGIKSLISSLIERFIARADSFLMSHFDFSRISPDPDGQITWLYVAEGALIMLSAIIYLALLIITIFVACNVSCSGNVAGGNALMIGGFVLFTTGLVFLIRTIHRRMREKRERLRGDGEFQ